MPSWRLITLLCGAAVVATVAALAGSPAALFAWPVLGLFAALLTARQSLRAARWLALGSIVAAGAGVALTPWLLLALWPPVAGVFGLALLAQSASADHRGRRWVPSPAAAASIPRPDRRPPAVTLPPIPGQIDLTNDDHLVEETRKVFEADEIGPPITQDRRHVPASVVDEHGRRA